MLRFLVRFTEPIAAGEAERLAIRRLRKEAFGYWLRLTDSDSLVWVFASTDATMTICLIETGSPEVLDAMVKRSPMFPYASVCCTPIVSSEAVAREILSSLGGSPISAALVFQAKQPDRRVVAEGEYWLVHKACPPFKVTETDERQRDVLERTVDAKTTIDPNVEFADLNVLGQMAGYLIGIGPREHVERYVVNCAVGDCIEWDIEPLVSIQRALRIASEEVGGLPDEKDIVVLRSE